jgi:hypothetical protein
LGGAGGAGGKIALYRCAKRASGEMSSPTGIMNFKLRANKFLFLNIKQFLRLITTSIT